MEWNFCLNWTAIVEEAKQRRKKQKLTQEQLANLANVSTPTVSNFENSHFQLGKIDIQLSSIISILEVLGMNDRRRLDFPDTKPIYYPHIMTLVFFGHDNEKEIKCAISYQALDDLCNMNKIEPVGYPDARNMLKAFKKLQDKVEHEARRKYLANNLELDNNDFSVFVKSSDL